tara:strand:- start:4055 stop:4621 length:567 start_codon:yes stop_codon:yes gene_type:complete
MNSGLFEETSDFPATFDVLPRLVDGIDFLTASYWNTLSSGSRRMTAALGSSPLTYDGVAWASGASIDDAFVELSRVDAGYATLTRRARSGFTDPIAYGGQITFKNLRFQRTSASGLNPNVPFVVLVSPGEADGRGITTNTTEGFMVSYVYDTSSPYLVAGFTVETVQTNGDETKELEIAWVAIESSIG